MSDPLLVLRNAILQNPEAPPLFFLNASGESVEELEAAEYIRLGTTGLTFPRQCPTNFRSKRGSGPFYTLDAVVFVLKHRDDSFSVYLQEARKRGLSVVSLVDKKDLVDYLTTAGADSPYVDHSEPLPTPVKGFKKSRKAIEETWASAPSAEVVKHRQMRSRNFDYLSDASFAFLHPAIKNALGIKDVEKKPEKSQSPKATKPKGSLIDQISSINKRQVAPGREADGKLEMTGMPIIIIPNAPSSLITLFNVKDWLEKSKFISSSDAKAAAPTKQTSVIVSHQFEGDTDATLFMVTDSPSSLSSTDWRRVVGTIVLGNTWQFKGWKWTSPADIFSNVVGFFVQWEDAQTDPLLGQWNVKRINISRNKRHLDSTAVLEFWHHLGQKMRSMKQ